MKRKAENRQLLGTGFIWFGSEKWPHGYRAVQLTSKPHGCGGLLKINVGTLGGWQKVRLYAELVLMKARTKRKTSKYGARKGLRHYKSLCKPGVCACQCDRCVRFHDN